MKILGVIPARYGSTRLPGKPLALIAGRPMLEWVIRGVSSSRRLAGLVVATDHTEIAGLAQKLGVEAVMTDPDLPSGSDRVWAAVQNREVDVVVNIQGDEPLMDGSLLDELAGAFMDHSVDMATLARPITPESLWSPQTAKIVVNAKDEAIYFSRLPIPYSRLRQSEASQQDLAACLKHIGVYAYRKDFLQTFCAQEPVLLEYAEGLEQLRALYLGAKIKVVRVNHDSWGVDTPDDLQRIEKILAERNRSGQKA